MIFGSREEFGIEIGEVLPDVTVNELYVQFRFLVFSHEIGDWFDRIPLTASMGNMLTFLSCKGFRKDASLRSVSCSELFEQLYDSFFEYDYTTDPVVQPNLRDRFHLADVGMGATSDKYAILAVDVSDCQSRIAVKDLRTEEAIADGFLDDMLIDNVGEAFLSWAKQIKAS